MSLGINDTFASDSRSLMPAVYESSPSALSFEYFCLTWNFMITGAHQSILKEISPGCSLEGMMLKLKSEYTGHLMQRDDWLEKTLMLGGIGGRIKRDNRGWDGWMASPTRWTWFWVNSGSWWWTGRPGVLRFMGLQRVRHNWAAELTELNWRFIYCQWFI